jgi:CheY-like chemotaxis protein
MVSHRGQSGWGRLWRMAAPQTADRPAAYAAAGGDPVPGGADILVAEDDPGIADLIQTVLEDEGYRVTAVGSGQAVLDAVQRRLPDLLLLDVRLEPGISGWEVLHRLEEMDRVVPTVMVTGDGRTLCAGAPDGTSSASGADGFAAGAGGEAGASVRSGAAAILAKPFDLDELLAVVERYRASRN